MRCGGPGLMKMSKARLTRQLWRFGFCCSVVLAPSPGDRLQTCPTYPRVGELDPTFGEKSRLGVDSFDLLIK